MDDNEAWRPYEDVLLAYPAPADVDGLFAAHVPDPTVVPTQNDADDVAVQLILIQDDLNTIPGRINDIARMEAELYFNISPSSSSYAVDGLRGRLRADDLRAAWLDYQQLRIQQMGLVSAALARIEHDIAWQAYATERYGDDPTQGRKTLSCALTKVREGLLVVKFMAVRYA